MDRTALAAAVGTLSAIAGLLVLAPSPTATASAATARAAVGAGIGAAQKPVRSTGLPARRRQVCPLVTSQPGVMSCQSVVNLPTAAQRAQAARAGAAAGPLTGYSPASLRSAYRLTPASAEDGAGETIAIVDAHSDPRAAANLAVYRSHFGLPACTTANGCLRIVNQDGKPGPLPTPSAAWALEESVDLDVVSAICPLCRILLVEAKTALVSNLAPAERTAAASGARFISDSWDSPEFISETSYDRDFDFPGVAVAVAAGDYGYAALYPASSPYVTAVGGTTLTRDPKSSRGWKERVWGESGAAGRFGDPYAPGTGSGCSMLEPKPAWQREKVDDKPSGCLNRTVADVAAVADPETGVSVYDTYASSVYGGSWLDIGGTSVAAPIIAATYALAGKPARGTYPASYPYRHASSLFNVTSGTNGECEASRRYLCHGQPGYNGPTGLGTPDGTGAFSDHGARPVTLVDPGTRDAEAGSQFSVKITGLDARPAARSLSYSATGLPAGLTIHALPHSTDAVISGTLPAAAASRSVTVAARDPVTGKAGSVRFMIVSVPTLSSGGAAAGEVQLRAGGLCLDAGADTAGSGVTADHCNSAAGQQWVYASAGAPGAGGTLTTSGGLCLERSGPAVVLAACQAGSQAQLWTLAGLGWLRNDLGECLAAPAAHVGLAGCRRVADMRWTLPAGMLASGVGGECAYSQAAGSTQAPFTVAPCDAVASAQQMALFADGSVQVGQECMDVPGPLEVGSSLDGAAVTQNLCVTGGPQTDQSQIWLLGPGGELINDYSGRCLADPGDGGSGTALRQEDCYGEPGEIWAVN